MLVFVGRTIWINRARRSLATSQEGVGRESNTGTHYEHGAVLVGLKILDKVTAAIMERNEQAPEHLEQLLDFFKGFVDGCHHGKEEDVLFPELERRGVKRKAAPSASCSRSTRSGEGTSGRSRTASQRLRAATTRRGRDQEHARALREMLRAHIRKESDDLFPMADRFVPDDVAATLAEQFEVIERERVGEGKHEAYHAMLHDLKDRYGVA